MLAPTQSQLLTPGQSAISTITDAPAYAVDKLSWRLISDADGSVIIAESGDALTAIDDGHDYPRCRYDRQFTAPTQPGRYLAIWRYFLEEIAQTVVVAATGSPTFASASDVEGRLGRSLTTSEQSQVQYLLETAAVVVADALGFDDGWAASLDPVPQMVRRMSVELVCRAMPNPNQYASISQQVGSYRIQVTQGATAGMQLSDAETLMLRRAVFGRTTESVRLDSAFEKAQDEYWLRKQSIRYASPNDPAAIIP